MRRSKPDDSTSTVRPSCTALVAVLPAAECKPSPAYEPRHDAFFVAQLIAMAQHSPQTRALRRASPQDAQTAYDSTVLQNRTAALPAARMLLVA
jgi:hypothetical protein